MIPRTEGSSRKYCVRFVCENTKYFVQPQLFIAVAMTNPATVTSKEITMEKVELLKAADIIKAKVTVSSKNGMWSK
ncbi:hypothetical protein D3C78_1498830 [compost metagenome]